VIEQRIVTETTPEARVAAARELTVANPELASGWLLLALALPQADPERVTDLERALERNPDSFLALSELALRRCADGHCSDGVELAERAVRIAPEDLRVLSACASVLSKAGQCARAVATQQRAVELLGHRSTTQQKQQVLARLAEYEQCH
jgi:cytochrome c-type biogenesis protein CcmH/NrfG